MQVTIGGDRLGSGNKLKTNLNNYQRSTHNLDQKWTSSMTVGALYPFLVLPVMRGDKFTIDLEAAARTIPTQGPLYGSFKMQLDIFECPARLYQAILHNNPLKIGLNMSQVMLPQIKCHGRVTVNDRYTGAKFNSSCLMKYLGVSGIARFIPSESDTGIKQIAREFNALPLLAYYDIFKTYYSNKQEENAYVISGKYEQVLAYVTKWSSVRDIPYDILNGDVEVTSSGNDYVISGFVRFDKKITKKMFYEAVAFVFDALDDDDTWGGEFKGTLKYFIEELGGTYSLTTQLGEISEDIDDSTESDMWVYQYIVDQQDLESSLIGEQGTVKKMYYSLITQFYGQQYGEPYEVFAAIEDRDILLLPFKLSNIDDMRLKLLSYNNLGSRYLIDGEDESDDEGIWGKHSGGDNNGLPYSVNSWLSPFLGDINSSNTCPLNGLVVKTYQSDIFNCWVNTEWIDGENGIAAVTAVSTASGKFTMDSLNLAEKLYDMLNRIAVSDGTYESWQDTVYTDSPRRHIESPIYLGGMSNEVVFEEIVQTTPTETEPLGNMGGRGVLVKRKGGHVVVNVNEAGFIIGIVSLTPRINYTQGNEFYMTDLKTLDDLHKPALDGIGFQNLMAERLAWFGAGKSGLNDNCIRQVVGKVPAWLEYMTAVDKAYGDFAEDEGKAFMVLNRNYEHNEVGGISDVTTYIDPTKYNYAFAYKALEAQNFWVQIKSNIKARRLMSAKQIPNL